MDELEARVAAIEGQMFAHSAVLALLVDKAFGRSDVERGRARDLVVRAIRRFYESRPVGDAATIAGLEAALDMAEAILADEA